MPDIRSVDPDTLKRMLGPASGEHGERERTRWLIRHLPGPKALTAHIEAVEKATLAAVDSFKDDPNPRISASAVVIADALDVWLKNAVAFRDSVQRFVDDVRAAIQAATPEVQRSELDVLARAILQSYGLSAAIADDLTEAKKQYLVWLGWRGWHDEGQSVREIRERWSQEFPLHGLNPDKATAGATIRRGIGRAREIILKNS